MIRPNPSILPPLALALALASGSQLQAQTTVRGRPCDGLFAFLIRNPATGAVVTRGFTTSSGGIPDGVALAPNRPFSITVGNGNGLIGSMVFVTPQAGGTVNIPPLQVGTSIAPDTDGDGVNDDIEEVYGLNPRSVSTAGNGIFDSVVINTPPPPGSPDGPNGIFVPGNPTFGPPGIVAGVQLAGTCVDVAAFADMAAVACLDRGVAVFNIFSGLSPRLIATVDTPGDARAVAWPSDDLAVADGPAGLAIVDLRDPAAASIRAQVPLGSFAQAVAARSGRAFVGLVNGQLVVVELSSATVLQRLNLGGPVYDVVFGGDHVWAVAGNSLRSFLFEDGFLVPVGNLEISRISPDPLSQRRRLFVGAAWAQVTCQSGFDAVDVSNPGAMRWVGRAATSGAGSFKHIVSNGSGLGPAAVGVNPRADGTHDVSLFNLGAPANTTDFLTTLRTPGTAYANVIFNGLDYVADGESGLQVLRIQDTDRMGVPPLVNLFSSAVVPPGGDPMMPFAEEGKDLRLTAGATDDKAVRNVEFFADGERLASDASFPFEVYLPTPLRTPAKDRVVFRARAFDDGGNSTWSDPLTVGLGSDQTPPFLVRSSPDDLQIVGGVNSVIAFFSEPLRAATVTPASFRLINAGADGLLGSPDDLAAPPGTLTYQESIRAAVWTFPTPLPRGSWQAVLMAPISDRAGNVIPQPFTFDFRTLAEPDRDRDGVPDADEPLLGLNSDTSDSKGDGILDGKRDFDGDKLSNAWERFWGFDPMVARSRVASRLDGDLDLDLDSLTNQGEERAGTDPSRPDSDSDGFNDESEVTVGSDPLDPRSTPFLLVTAGAGAAPPVLVGLPRLPTAFGAAGLTVGRPPVAIGLPQLAPGSASGLVVAHPRIIVGLPVFDGSSAQSLFVARPPVQIGLPSANPASLGLTLGQPPVQIRIQPQ